MKHNTRPFRVKPTPDGNFPAQTHAFERARRTYFLPIAFCCPRCQQEVKSKDEKIFCDCISVPYKGRLDGVIPKPDEIIPLIREGTEIDASPVGASFRWGRLVARQSGDSILGVCFDL
jgi:hypothetical protein